MNKIYFAGSIRGGRNDLELYREIISYLTKFGEVLTEHIGEAGLTPMGESGISDSVIYHRDIDWLSQSGFVVAEVSTPSLGVGFEISRAVELNKKVLCLYRIQQDRKLSAMISGCPDIQVKEYQTLEEAKQIINVFFNFTT
jgi:hypothetical protein